MTLGRQLRVNKFSVRADLEAALIRGNQFERFDQMLELLEELIRQAHGPAGVMSNRTINDLDLEHKPSMFRSHSTDTPGAHHHNANRGM